MRGNRPDAFGLFHVRTELGAGRFGPVYAGRDSSNARVIIRTFELSSAPRDSAEPTELLDSLRKLCANSPDHPSIARHLAFGVEGGIPYLVSTYLEGTGMDASIQTDGARPLDDVLERVTHIASAIDLASTVGVYHGMMEPHDVFFDAARTGVTGFGLAQALVRAGISVEGRPPYASPQRQAGALPTCADDVYSLAAIALELVIGKPSVGSQDTSGALRQAQGLPERRRVPRPAPHETRLFTAIQGVDAGKLRAVFASAFSEEPGDRPATGAAFVTSFKEAIVDRFDETQPATSPILNPVSAFASEDEGVATPSRSSLGPSEAIEPASNAIHGSSETVDRASDKVHRASDKVHRENDKVHRASDSIQRPSDSTQRPRTAPAPMDLPLRHQPIAEPEMTLSFAEPVVHESPSIVRPALSGSTWETPAAHRSSLAFPLTVAITVALIAGFASGFAMGRRSTTVATRAPSVPEQVAAPLSAPPSGTPTTADDPAAPSAPQTIAPAPTPTAPAPTPTAPAPTPAPGDGAKPIAEAPSIATSQPPVAAPKPSTPESQPGRVLVRSTPAGANVTVDGQPRGATPLALRDLALGEHTIEVTSAGHDARQQRVRLTARRPARSVDFELRPTGTAGQALAVAGGPGGLQISSRPSGAEVFLDDNLIGTTPLLVSTVPPGSHRVRLQMPGYQTWSTAVQIESGARFRVAASLEQ